MVKDDLLMHHLRKLVEPWNLEPRLKKLLALPCKTCGKALGAHKELQFEMNWKTHALHYVCVCTKEDK